MLTENIMQRAFVRSVTINLGGQRLPPHVSTMTGAAMREICAWSATITGSISVVRNLTMIKPNHPISQEDEQTT